MAKKLERLVGAYPKAHIEAMIKTISGKQSQGIGGHDRTKKWSPNFLPKDLVIFGNLALFLWIVLD